jgi:acyl-coenzyme A thioesterase PaaI-like protein
MAEFFATSLMERWAWRLQVLSLLQNPSLRLNLKINFFRPVWQAQLRVEGIVVRRGQSIGYVECIITDENSRLVAKAASTCMVLRAQKTAGR